DNAAAVIESDAIDEGNQGRNNLFAADAHQLVLHFFRMIDALDTHLIVDAKDNRATAGVRQRDDALGDAFRIRELNFEFEVSIFAAAHEAHQLGTVSQRRGGLIKVFLERTVSDRFVALGAAEAFASHLCNGGAGERARTRSQFASLGFQVNTSREIDSQCSIAASRKPGSPVTLRGGSKMRILIGIVLLFALAFINAGKAANSPDTIKITNLYSAETVTRGVENEITVEVEYNFD